MTQESMPRPGRAAAVFDVDRTLVLGTSMEQIFLSYLIRRRHFRLVDAVRMVASALGQIGYLWRERTLQLYSYLSGREAGQVQALARDCFEHWIVPRLAREGLTHWEAHRAGGDYLILLSGSLPFLLEPLAEQLRPDYVVGTELEVLHDRYTGRRSGHHPRGQTKARLVREIAEQHGLDLSISTAYGDHWSDVPLLEIFGHPVAANPHPRLSRIARARGWRIERWHRLA